MALFIVRCWALQLSSLSSSPCSQGPVLFVKVLLVALDILIVTLKSSANCRRWENTCQIQASSVPAIALRQTSKSENLNTSWAQILWWSCQVIAWRAVLQKFSGIVIGIAQETCSARLVSELSTIQDIFIYYFGSFFCVPFVFSSRPPSLFLSQSWRTKTCIMGCKNNQVSSAVRYKEPCEQLSEIRSLRTARFFIMPKTSPLGRRPNTWTVTEGLIWGLLEAVWTYNESGLSFDVPNIEPWCCFRAWPLACMTADKNNSALWLQYAGVSYRCTT